MWGSSKQCFLQCGCEGSDAIRFLEKWPARLQQIAPGGTVLRIPRSNQHSDVGKPVCQISGELLASHAGHDEVRHDEIDLCLVSFADFQCRFSICRFQDLVAEMLQTIANVGSNRVIVVNDENGLALEAS